MIWTIACAISACRCDETAFVSVISYAFLRTFSIRRRVKSGIHLPYSLHDESGSSRTRRRSCWEHLKQQPCRGSVKGLFRDRKRLRDCLETMSAPPSLGPQRAVLNVPTPSPHGTDRVRSVSRMTRLVGISTHRGGYAVCVTMAHVWSELLYQPAMQVCVGQGVR